jgi:membrane dipeptidase
MTDDMLRALAKNDGVAMANFWSAFIDPAYMAASKAFATKHAKEIADIKERYKEDPEQGHDAMEKLKAGESLPVTPISVLIDHIEHMIQVAGIDHVGLGSDFDGVDALPEGLGGIDGLPNITLELLRRGHSEEDVRKVLGQNFLRVLEAADAHRASTKTTLSGDGSTKSIEKTK